LAAATSRRFAAKLDSCRLPQRDCEKAMCTMSSSRKKPRITE